MPIKTYKSNKNNKKPTLRKNVKKGVANYIENQTMKQSHNDKQRWESLRHKYEYKESE